MTFYEYIYIHHVQLVKRSSNESIFILKIHRLKAQLGSVPLLSGDYIDNGYCLWSVDVWQQVTLKSK